MGLFGNGVSALQQLNALISKNKDLQCSLVTSIGMDGWSCNVSAGQPILACHGAVRARLGLSGFSDLYIAEEKQAKTARKVSGAAHLTRHGNGTPESYHPAFTPHQPFTKRQAHAIPPPKWEAYSRQPGRSNLLVHLLPLNSASPEKSAF